MAISPPCSSTGSAFSEQPPCFLLSISDREEIYCCSFWAIFALDSTNLVNESDITRASSSNAHVMAALLEVASAVFPSPSVLVPLEYNHLYPSPDCLIVQALS